MTVDEYKQLPLRERMLFEFFTVFERDIKRIADSLERLTEMDEQ